MVLPPGVWRFEGRMRTQEITTDQGLGFRLLDPENTRLLDARTASLTGTHDWTLLSVGFEVHPATRVVEVRVFRTPSLKFDKKLGGTAWIDGLVLRRERAADRRPPAMSFNLPIERQRQSVKQAANSVDPLGLTPIACPPGTTNKMCVDPVKETVLHGFSPGLGWDPFSAFSTAFEPTDVASGPPVNDDPTTVDVYGNIGMLDIIGLTSGGATGGNSVFQKACSLVPQGCVLGIQGAVGGVSGQTGTLEQVLNYTTGETTLFASGGIQAGVWNGGAQGNAIGGLIYGNLKGDNSNYRGPFTTLSESLNGVGGFIAASGGGLGNPVPDGGMEVVGGSFGVSLVGSWSATTSVTYYTPPLSAGSFTGFDPQVDLGFLVARQICK